MLVAGNAHALNWEIVPVDETGDVGWFASIALDHQDVPGIAYCDYGVGDLKFARMGDVQWLVMTVDATGNTGWYASLRFDSNDLPRIAYWDLTNSALRYARWDGTAWQKETVDNAAYVGQSCSLALDALDRPHISYYDYTNGDLKYAHWDGTAWIIEVLDTGPPQMGTGLYTSLVLDPSGYPHISYADHTQYLLRYAFWNGSAWVKETVDGGTPIGTSLELDAEGDAHISYAYQFGQGSHLKYAVRDHETSTWTVRIVRPGGDAGWYSSLELDAAGNPSILSWELGDHLVQFDRYDGSSWTHENVEAMDWVDQWCSLALDRYGRAHAAYRRSGTLDLHYALGSEPAGLSDRQLPVRLLLPVRDGRCLVVEPNPAFGSAEVRFNLGRAAPVRLTAVDVTGRLLGTLWDGLHSAGETSFVLDRGRVPAGVSFLVLQAAGETATQKVIRVE